MIFAEKVDGGALCIYGSSVALATVTPRRPGLSPNMSGSVRSLDDSWCYKKVKLGQPETSNLKL